eukprot:TRINITY_DN8376_c0_g2_i1.p1 TRINITY_DN8376_c0_g2~~TRINITY_DN8376_c0_g2_i1.p1  ORF type:complete len:350 (-),score=131.34 TRINITY_DN8376_c0_g2_i1:263-1312(-)
MGQSDTSRHDSIQLYSFDTEAIPKPRTYHRWCERLLSDPKAWAIFTRQVEYHMLLEEVVAVVLYVTKGSVQWTCVPGYYKLILPFLLLMRKSAPKYTVKMQKTSKLLLQNVLLFNIMMDFTFSRADLYYAPSVLHAVENCNSWLACLRRDVKVHHLPPCINFSFFFRIIRMLLVSERYDLNFAVLTLIFKNLHLFAKPQRRVLVQEMLFSDEIFYRFALHWHHNMRVLFCFILVFKVSTIEEIGFSFSIADAMIDGQDVLLKKQRVVDEECVALRDEKVAALKRSRHAATSGRPLPFPSEWLVYLAYFEDTYEDCLKRCARWEQNIQNDRFSGDLVFPEVEYVKMASGE